MCVDFNAYLSGVTARIDGVANKKPLFNCVYILPIFPLFYCSYIPPYVQELVSMNQKPLPYPPQMRNGGLPPAHLPSTSHSNPVAAIPNLKAIVSDAIAVLAKKALARCHEAATREKALANEANEQR
jgi:hypothetical protein